MLAETRAVPPASDYTPVRASSTECNPKLNTKVFRAGQEVSIMEQLALPKRSGGGSALQREWRRSTLTIYTARN